MRLVVAGNCSSAEGSANVELQDEEEEIVASMQQRKVASEDMTL